VLFTDAGNVWRTSATFPLNELHYAGGCGLRLDTPIGPVRTDFAWKINRQAGEQKRFEFHLSIGHAF
jgi:outer membrane protein insertion porin family